MSTRLRGLARRRVGSASTVFRVEALSFDDAHHAGSEFRFIQQGRRLDTPDGTERVVVQVGQITEQRTPQHSSFLSGPLGLVALSLIGLGFVRVAIRTSLAPLERSRST